MSPKEALLTAEYVRSLFDYDKENGLLTRRTDHPIGRFKRGQVAGGVTNWGYVRVSIHNMSFMAHRITWLWVTGEWPKDTVDHIDGDRANNRWANLRDVSRRANAQNQRNAKKGNSTGLLGVSRSQQAGKFQASIYVQGRLRHLGTFDDSRQAHEAYIAAKRLHHEGNTL